MDDIGNVPEKPHRSPKAGRKAEKKKIANLKKRGLLEQEEKKKKISTPETNPKVFLA
jgi:ribosomal protein S19E (S16A)